jgi:hypothetical protein
MARIRTIKPDFFTHPSIVVLSVPARLLFVALWTQADDEGRLYDQPAKIRGLSFGDTDKVSVDRLLEELAEHGRIVRYDAMGRDCIEVVDFDQHQRINRPSPSSIPAPGLFTKRSPSGQGVLTEPSSPERKGKERKGRDGKGVTPRERDVIADTLARIEGGSPLEVPSSHMRTLCVKANELRKVAPDVTPAEVERRAANWSGHMHDATISGPAVVKHWARLAQAAKPTAATNHPLDRMARDLIEGVNANGDRGGTSPGATPAGELPGVAGE